MLIIHNMAGDPKSMLVDAPELSEFGASIGSRLDEVEALLCLAQVYIRQGSLARRWAASISMGLLRNLSDTPTKCMANQWVRILFYLAVGAPDEAECWADVLYSERETIPTNPSTLYFVEVACARIAAGK